MASSSVTYSTDTVYAVGGGEERKEQCTKKTTAGRADMKGKTGNKSREKRKIIINHHIDTKWRIKVSTVRTNIEHRRMGRKGSHRKEVRTKFMKQ